MCIILQYNCGYKFISKNVIKILQFDSIPPPAVTFLATSGYTVFQIELILAVDYFLSLHKFGTISINQKEVQLNLNKLYAYLHYLYFKTSEKKVSSRKLSSSIFPALRACAAVCKQPLSTQSTYRKILKKILQKRFL